MNTAPLRPVVNESQEKCVNVNYQCGSLSVLHPSFCGEVRGLGNVETVVVASVVSEWEGDHEFSCLVSYLQAHIKTSIYSKEIQSGRKQVTVNLKLEEKKLHLKFSLLSLCLMFDLFPFFDSPMKTNPLVHGKQNLTEICCLTLSYGIEYCLSMDGEMMVILCLRNALHASSLLGKKRTR